MSGKKYTREFKVETIGLIKVNSIFYGTTKAGGANGNGTVFSLDPNSGTESVVHSFSGGTDGAQPFGNLLYVKGSLYGTTEGGGSGSCNDPDNGCGTLFSIDPATGVETVLYSFCTQQECTSQGNPNGDLIEVNGNLYGTSAGGGFMTVYEVSP